MKMIRSLFLLALLVPGLAWGQARSSGPVPNMFLQGTVPAGDLLIGLGGNVFADGGVPSGIGNVTGPASSTDGHIATFSGATGKIIQDRGTIAGPNSWSALQTFNGGTTTTAATATSFVSAAGDVLLKPVNCGSTKVVLDSSGTGFNVASPHGCTSVSFTGAISGLNLTTTGAPSLIFGQTISGAGVTAGTVITGGSGDAWTVNNSQTVASESMTASATAKNNLILRPSNQGETYFQFATSDSSPPDFESGILIQSNVNGFQLRATTGGGILTQLFNGASNGTITWPAGTTNFQSTGGTHQVVEQASSGAPFTVGQLATSDLSNIGSFNLNTTGTALVGSNGQVSIFSTAGAPTVTSDASHNLTIKSGIGNALLIGDSVVSIGSGQTNYFTANTGSGDPLLQTTGGNFVIQAAGTSKIIFKNATNGQAGEIFNQSGGNNFRIFTGSPVRYSTNAGNVQLDSAGGTTILNDATIKYGSSSAWSANGAVATSLTGIGPTGSHTTVQEWLTITDNGGNVRYIPAF